LKTIRLFIWKFVVPKILLTRVMGLLAEIRFPILKNFFINHFVKKYNVNLSEAVYDNAAQYKTFNDFFIRKLKPNARIFANSKFICPVDGSISAIGIIKSGQLFQAKGHTYTPAALLANAKIADQFNNGLFATLYLAPKDYHRIHMPIAGEVLSMTYVPGKLYSVNPKTVDLIPDLFALNERVIVEFSTAAGKLVMVLVGATIVGSINVVWHGDFLRGTKPWTVDYRQNPNKILLEQGQEMGYFKLGSTVIVLLKGNDSITWLDSLIPMKNIKLGEQFIQ
jgi:phosphatidylserine decarboxylase